MCKLGVVVKIIIALRGFVLFIGALLSASTASGAEEEAAEGEEAVETEEIRYIELRPTFVTNFGFSTDGRLKFLKADVSARVNTRDAASAVKYHLPAVRHTLVHLFSRQDESTVATSEGREAMRVEAIAELRALLEAEEGEPFVEDVLFTNFILQR